MEAELFIKIRVFYIKEFLHSDLNLTSQYVLEIVDPYVLSEFLAHSYEWLSDTYKRSLGND